MKTCSKCGVAKEEADFFRDSGKKGKRRGVCKRCDSIRAKGYRLKNQEKMADKDRAYYIKNREKILSQCQVYRKENEKEIKSRRRNIKYRFVSGEFEDLLTKQAGVCAICGGLGGKKGLGVDHDHESGKVRALLCGTCNSALGHLKDSSALAQAATDYLKQHGK